MCKNGKKPGCHAECTRCQAVEQLGTLTAEQVAAAGTVQSTVSLSIKGDRVPVIGEQRAPATAEVSH